MKNLLTIIIIVLMLAIDWLAFHDIFEPHSIRDWLTLAVSLLVFLYFALERTKKS